MRSLLKLSFYILTINCLATESIINYGSLPAFSINGNLQIVVEIPAGTNKKFEYDHATNTFPVDIKNAKERSINFLPYPGNYGFIPSTIMDKSKGGDGDALDVLVLSQHLQVGNIIEVIPIAVLNLIDNGELDSKIIAVPFNPIDQIIKATSSSQLNTEYPNIKPLIKLWFTSYKGGNEVKFDSWGDEIEARAEIEKWLVIH